MAWLKYIFVNTCVSQLRYVKEGQCEVEVIPSWFYIEHMTYLMFNMTYLMFEVSHIPHNKRLKMGSRPVMCAWVTEIPLAHHRNITRRVNHSREFSCAALGISPGVGLCSRRAETVFYRRKELSVDDEATGLLLDLSGRGRLALGVSQYWELLWDTLLPCKRGI